MSRGALRIYLGAAPGVGKTYAMLNEGWRRHERGADVVIGVVETHGRTSTSEQLRDLEIVPRGQIEYRGSTLQEMDLDAILRRAPALCLVDELAHSNAPGSRNEKRWQDVEMLLAAGIDVISTVNVQHLESLNDVVERITGVPQREKVPDSVVRGADQIELVDMSAEALRRRMAHGNIYPAERIDAALSNYFRPGNLGALRELALLWVADRVDESLQSYLEDHGIDEVWETRERVLVAVSSAATSDTLIRRGARIARRAKGDLLAVHVVSSDGRIGASEPDGLATRQRLVTELGGAYREVVADDAATALIAFARSEHATQLVLGTGHTSRWNERLGRSFVQRVIAGASGMDVHVVAAPSAIDDRLPRPTPKQRSVSQRRLMTAWTIVAIGLPVLTVALVAVRDRVSLSAVLLAFLLLVLVVATIGGRLVSLVAAVAAAIIENWFFAPPLGTLTIGNADDGVSIAMFLVVAATVGTLVERTSRRAYDAQRARAEAEALARTMATLAADPDPLPVLLDQLRTTFGFVAAAVLAETSDGWTAVASAGNPPPTEPIEGATFAIRTSTATPDHVLVVAGLRPNADDLRLFAAFAAQLAVALESQRLLHEANSAHALEHVDATRTALLRAVSHDLRSPLAAIKTHVSGLRAGDVKWTAEQIEDGLEDIEMETDRLDRLVGNLLDAGRLQAGMTAVHLSAVAVDEVIKTVMRTLRRSGIELSLPSDLPLINSDSALLERCIENLISNALSHGASSQPIRIDAATVGDHIHVRVVDRGVGVAAADRAKVIAPFHRLGDRNATDGVGLGLAITDGFVTALNGKLLLEDTPGGGLTATIALPIETPATETKLNAGLP